MWDPFFLIQKFKKDRNMRLLCCCSPCGHWGDIHRNNLLIDLEKSFLSFGHLREYAAIFFSGLLNDLVAFICYQMDIILGFC